MQDDQKKSSRVFYGYIAVGASSIIMMLMFGSLYSFGVFFKPFLSEFGWSRAETSGAFSLSFFMQGLMGVPVGRLTDRFGPRLVATVCGVFLGSGFMLMSFINAIWQIYLVYGVIIAFGVSAAVALMGIPSRWFFRRRGLMTGIVISGVGLGTVIMPPIANWLIATYDWRFSCVIIGIGILIVMVTAAQFLRRDPKELGLAPYGAGSTNTRAMNVSGDEFSFSSALRTWQFWMLGMLFFFHTYCVQTVMAHVVLHAQGAGLAPATAAGIIAVVGASSIAGRLILGTVLDRIGSRPVLTASFLIKAAALAILLFARTEWVFIIFAALFGLGYGGAAVAHTPMIADLFGLTSLSMILAGVSLVGTVGAAIGPVAAGRIFDVRGSYFWAFLITIAVSVLGFFMTMLVKPVEKGEVDEP